MAKRITVKGVRRDEVDVDQLALVYYLMAKRQVAEKRQKAADVRDKRAAVKEARRGR